MGDILTKNSHAEINQDWLTKLDLRQRDPIVRKVKRIMDIIWIAGLGLVLAFPLLLIWGFFLSFSVTNFPCFSSKEELAISALYSLQVENNETRFWKKWYMGGQADQRGKPMLAGYCVEQGLMKSPSFGM